MNELINNQELEKKEFLDIFYFTKGMKKLNAYFSKEAIDEYKQNIYYDKLKELTAEQFKFAVEKCIEKEIFFPKIEILNIYGNSFYPEYQGGDLKSKEHQENIKFIEKFIKNNLGAKNEQSNRI